MKCVIIQQPSGKFAVYQYRADAAYETPIAVYEHKSDAHDKVYELTGDDCPACYAHGVFVPSQYLRDLEQLADKLRTQLDLVGVLKHSDFECVYHASAAWRDEPRHYVYEGVWWDFPPVETLGVHVMDSLFGIRDALREMGLVLTYDKHGKHRIFGNCDYYRRHSEICEAVDYN